jgi:hypothetical protein
VAEGLSASGHRGLHNHGSGQNCLRKFLFGRQSVWVAAWSPGVVAATLARSLEPTAANAPAGACSTANASIPTTNQRLGPIPRTLALYQACVLPQCGQLTLVETGAMKK